MGEGRWSLVKRKKDAVRRRRGKAKEEEEENENEKVNGFISSKLLRVLLFLFSFQWQLRRLVRSRDRRELPSRPVFAEAGLQDGGRGGREGQEGEEGREGREAGAERQEGARHHTRGGWAAAPLEATLLRCVSVSEKWKIRDKDGDADRVRVCLCV